MVLNNRHVYACTASGLLLSAGCFMSPAVAGQLVRGSSYYLDFETNAAGQSLVAGEGQTIAQQWADWGLTLSATSARKGADDMLLLYDTATSGADNDLRTGEFNYKGESFSSSPENNVLIIHEHIHSGNVKNDQTLTSIYNPDDEAKGGTITFDFSSWLQPNTPAPSPTYRGVDLGTLRLVDIDDNPTLSGVRFRAFSGDNEVFSKSAEELRVMQLATSVFDGVNNKGDNSIWDFHLGAFQREAGSEVLGTAVTKLLVEYDGSGAIAGLGWSDVHESDEDRTEIPEPTSLLGLAVVGAGLLTSAGARRGRSRSDTAV